MHAWRGTDHETLAAHVMLEERGVEAGPYADSPYSLNGDVYSDASGSFPKCPHCRTIAYSAVVMQE